MDFTVLNQIKPCNPCNPCPKNRENYVNLSINSSVSSVRSKPEDVRMPDISAELSLIR